MTISVVIPLFNQYELTAACLRRLERCDPVHEVILVDNGSTDATTQLDVTIRNPENLGFAAACNQGARAATGDIVLFLNNDTQVKPGWTKFTRHLHEPDVGIAGCTLTYDTDDIQHAGIDVDFSQPWGLEAANLRAEWTDQPEEVDAVTGACLAIRKSFFEALGGFDEGFWNGYEDVDLCLSCLAAGKRVIYDPCSKIVHYESQSGPERWRAVGQNIARLREKWDANARRNPA